MKLSNGKPQRTVVMASSIYALSHISPATSDIRKLFRYLFLVIGIIGSSYKSYNFFKMYFLYPIVFTLEEEQVKSLEFPAVSICNFNRMKKFGLSLGTPLLLSERSSSFYCNAANDSEQDEIKESLQQFYEMDEERRRVRGHKPSDFMQKCFFRGRFCPRNHLPYFQNLRYGNCITFN
ncbi:degenerin deg-1 [Nephila pilipes]|uniref:Degenerin deg-1 n=1 Tax=Nephila pilipes TaxID=299642 RepID=A0A8X6MJQ3_NEPPI|nr:degenerin deg-1 [Nephila pilipes]